MENNKLTLEQKLSIDKFFTEKGYDAGALLPVPYNSGQGWNESLLSLVDIVELYLENNKLPF